MVDLKAKLSRMIHKADDLEKENALLKLEVAALHKHIGKVKEEAIEEFRDPNLISMKWGVTKGMVLKTFENKLSSCSLTWTSPKFKSMLMSR